MPGMLGRRSIKNHTGMGSYILKIMTFLREFSWMEDVRAKEDLSKPMEATTRETLKIMLLMVMAYMWGKKGSDSKANGKIMFPMGMGRQPIQMSPDT